MAESFTTFAKAGVGFNRKTDVSEHLTGDTVMMVGVTATGAQKFAMYIKAPSAIGALSYCTVDQTANPFLASSVDGGAGTALFQNGSIAFAAGEYGWLMSAKTVVSDAARAITADNALTLLGKTWTAPGAIGGVTPGTAVFTTIGGTNTLLSGGLAVGGSTAQSGGVVVKNALSANTPSAVVLDFPVANTARILTSGSNTSTYALLNFDQQFSDGTGYAHVASLSYVSAKSNFTIIPPTSSAGLAAGTLYSNAGIATFA